MRDRRQPIGGAVLAGKDAEHTRHRQRPPHVDPHDPGMRVRRAHDRGIGLSRQNEIVAEPALSGQQALILLAAQRLADGAEALQSRNIDRVIHVSASGHA